MGAVFFGLDCRGEVSHQRRQFIGKRDEIQTLSAQTGLDLIRRKLLEQT